VASRSWQSFSFFDGERLLCCFPASKVLFGREPFLAGNAQKLEDDDEDDF
jgi:hypothetical protein